MLKNDPPPGTKVIFTRNVQKAAAYDVATLVKPLRTYFTERAEDEFEVEFRGERFTVQRQDIT
jgi:hypothetical protein